MSKPDCVNYRRSTHFLTKDLLQLHKELMKKSMSFPSEYHMNRHLESEGSMRRAIWMILLPLISMLASQASHSSHAETESSFVGRLLSLPQEEISLWFPLGSSTLEKFPVINQMEVRFCLPYFTGTRED